MKNLVIIVVSILAFASCTDVNETEEQAIELQEIQLIDPDDNGTIDPDDEETGDEGKL